jgi:hypothetical protein
MANPDASFGFRPYQAQGGTPGRIGKYSISSAYNTAIFQGDLVQLSGTGGYGRGFVNTTTSNTAQVVGVFAGCEYVATDGSVVRKNNWVASTATKSGTPIWAYVHDDPNQLFIAQCDGTTVVTDIGTFCGVVTTNAGNAVTGISGQEVSTGQASETTLMIVRLIDAQDALPCRNDVGNQDVYAVGVNGLVVVKIMKHQNGNVASVEV